jgi:hypothetical protein
MVALERTYETNTSFLAGNNGCATEDMAEWNIGKPCPESHDN